MVSRIKGPEEAINEIKKIENIDNLLESNCLFSSVLGEMFRMDNNISQAKNYHEKALSLTQSEPGKKLLEKKIAFL